MGALDKRAMHVVNQCLTFILGEPVDDEHALQTWDSDEPPFGIPKWNWKKGIRYHTKVLNVETGTKRLDFSTLVIVFRVNRGSYDQPRFYHIDKYGVRRLQPSRSKKRIVRERREQFDLTCPRCGKVAPIKSTAEYNPQAPPLCLECGYVMDEQYFVQEQEKARVIQEVVNTEWAIKWDFIKEDFIHFDCSQCGKHVEDCECIECPLCFEVGSRNDGDRPWSCRHCEVDYDLHGYWKGEEYNKVTDDYDPDEKRKDKDSLLYKGDDK